MVHLLIYILLPLPPPKLPLFIHPKFLYKKYLMASLQYQILVQLILFTKFCQAWTGKNDGAYSLRMRVLSVHRYGAKGDGTDATLVKLNYYNPCIY